MWDRCRSQDNLRDSLKMLDVLSGDIGLQDIVEETISMYMGQEKLIIYQIVKERGEARGLRKMVLRLLTKLPPE